MAIEFKDFHVVEPFRRTAYDSEANDICRLKDEANKWLATLGNVRVLNVETLKSITGGGYSSVDVKLAGIRVWFEVLGA